MRTARIATANPTNYTACHHHHHHLHHHFHNALLFVTILQLLAQILRA